MPLPVSDCSREEENSLESVFVPLVDIIHRLCRTNTTFTSNSSADFKTYLFLRRLLVISGQSRPSVVQRAVSPQGVATSYTKPIVSSCDSGVVGCDSVSQNSAVRQHMNHHINLIALLRPT